MAQRKKAPIILSPIAEARYPHLNKADDRFGDPVYKVSLVFESEDDAQFLIDIFNEKQQEAIQKAIDEAAEKGKTLRRDKVKLAHLPVRPEENADGEDTGRVVVGPFKAKASGVTRDGRKWERKVPVFDSKGNPVDLSTTSIWGGSRVKLAFIPEPFYTSGVGAGVTLRLEAVQLIELRSGGARDAGSYGFGAEDGYEAEEESTTDYTAPEDGSEDGSSDIPF